VLIFDEATSALDTVTERAVMDAIDILANQKTIILITHRLSTVKKCGQIVLLENGRIKATGTFDEMVENVARFRSFVNG
jgi:ABC-type multidrug transport system fused ATPase/permease subunit